MGVFQQIGGQEVMNDKNGDQLSNEVYRVVKKPGTSLVNSRETEGRKRALLWDKDSGMKGPPELVQVEPEVVEKRVVIEKPIFRTRVVEKNRLSLDISDVNWYLNSLLNCPV